MSTKPFYNTIQLDQNQLAVENAKAKGLQAVIEVLFKTNPLKEYSGWQMKHILEMYLDKKVNINSVRRSITNLKNEGILGKTENMVMGDEGKNEHLYRLTRKPEPVYQNGNAALNGIQGDLFLNS